MVACTSPEAYTTFIHGGGDLLAPRYMTFGKTDPSTVDYVP
jgi:hypothetical protein